MENSSPKFIIIETTVDTHETANQLASYLCGAKFAACIQVHAIESTFNWNGQAMRDDEYVLRIKTHVDRYEDCEQFLLSNHPYECPELIVTPIIKGSPSYLTWLKTQVDL